MLIAPGAQIIVCFAPSNGDRGFVDAVSADVHDNLNKPSVISISCDGPEIGCSDQGKNNMDETLKETLALGVTVCYSVGDVGSLMGWMTIAFMVGSHVPVHMH